MNSRLLSCPVIVAALGYFVDILLLGQPCQRRCLIQLGTLRLGLISSATATGILCLTVALLSLSRLEETCGRELDFLER